MRSGLIISTLEHILFPIVSLTSFKVFLFVCFLNSTPDINHLNPNPCLKIDHLTSLPPSGRMKQLTQGQGQKKREKYKYSNISVSSKELSNYIFAFSLYGHILPSTSLCFNKF